MIEPIEFVSNDDFHRFRMEAKNNGKFIVLYIDRSKKEIRWFGVIRTTKDSYSEYEWVIDRCYLHRNKNALIGEKEATTEACLEFVAKNYPEHYEWILFHPECL